MVKDEETIRDVILMLENIVQIDPDKMYPAKLDGMSVIHTPLEQAVGLAEIALDELGNSEVYEDLTAE